MLNRFIIASVIELSHLGENDVLNYIASSSGSVIQILVTILWCIELLLLCKALELNLGILGLWLNKLLLLDSKGVGSLCYLNLLAHDIKVVLI